MKNPKPDELGATIAHALDAAEAAGININVTLRSKDWLGSPEALSYAPATLERTPDRLADQLRTIAGDDGMVTISITPKGHFDVPRDDDGPEPEFAEVDGDARADKFDKVRADAEHDPFFENFEVRAPRFNYGQTLMLRTSVEAWQAQQRNHERDTSLGDRGGVRLMEFTPPIEAGRVIGISTFCNGGMPNYLIRYRAGDGRQVEEWHNEAAVVPHPGGDWASANFS